MRILYVAMEDDYGDPARGPSFEHWNFHESLAADGHELIPFDFMRLGAELGRTRMNRRLLEVARSECPDLMFAIMFKDELDPEVVRTISELEGTVTLNWFCDDHWRFETFSARWAPCFNWVVTTATDALPKYEALGYANVIKSQWGCNHHLYRRLEREPLYDVSFVGQPYGDRVGVIQALRDAGIEVAVRGYGWPEGRIDQDAMIEFFNRSRINLNMPNASRRSAPAPPASGHGRALRLASRAVRTLPRGDRAIAALKRTTPVAGEQLPLDDDAVYPEQIKARNFEVPGCGGFLLTGPADDLDRYYEPGKEIATFASRNELVELARHYLAHDDARRSIAEAGYQRTVREHTYTARFGEIFAAMGLPAGPPNGPA